VRGFLTFLLSHISPSPLLTLSLSSIKKWVLTERVDLDLTNRQTTSRRQDEPEISPGRNTVEAVGVWGHVVLKRGGGKALGVACCVVCRAAAAHPDLEAVKAKRAAVRSAPDRSATNRGCVAQVNLPPWSHVNWNFVANPGSSASTREAIKNSIVAIRGWKPNRIQICRLGRSAGLVLAAATKPGEVGP
jgi:hypothetical protein